MKKLLVCIAFSLLILACTAQPAPSETQPSFTEYLQGSQDLPHDIFYFHYQITVFSEEPGFSVTTNTSVDRTGRVANQTVPSPADLRRDLVNFTAAGSTPHRFTALNKTCYALEGIKRDQSGKIACFDKDTGLVYYEQPVNEQKLWVVPSAFNLPPAGTGGEDVNSHVREEWGDAKEHATIAENTAKKIPACKDPACKAFFQQLARPGEHQYTVNEAKQTDAPNYGSYTHTYGFHGDNVTESTTINGDPGLPLSETQIKAEASEHATTCNITRTSPSCYTIRPNRSQECYDKQDEIFHVQRCTYCFATDHLESVTCKGQGSWNWTKTR